MSTSRHYKYGGAEALVNLHEIHFKRFVETWEEAKKLNVQLPATSDPDYESLETLLFHLFRASRGYIVWICEKLGTAVPAIPYPPENIAAEKDEYLQILLEQWRIPLKEIEEERFHNPSYKSNWGSDYNIDAMLEHAVMHPIRHEFQLRNLIGGK